MKSLRRLLATAGLWSGGLAAGLPASVGVDWPRFLARHDLVWEQFPPSWNTGGFTGNGQIGMMIYATLDDHRVDFHLGRTDVTDHRRAPDRKTSFGVPGANVHYDFPRLDVGRLALRPAGKIRSGTMRLDLWNAEVTGVLTTELGTLSFRAYTHRDRTVDVIDVTSREFTADGRPAPWRWEFRPGNPIAPRRLTHPKDGLDYVTNPPPTVVVEAASGHCVQSLRAGGDYATAWLDRRASPDRGTLFVSIANEIPRAGASLPVAVDAVGAAAATDSASLLASHRAWWHTFYAASFLSIPDARLESFYWIQLYKIASASRADGPLVDDQGPFFRVNQWPYATWDLNVQLTYWLPLASNHLDLGLSFIAEMDRNFDVHLRLRAKSPQLGDLAWLMHNYWWHYRYAGDAAAVRTKWLPKAARVAAAYLERLLPGDDGRLHLPPMQSPEYHPPGSTTTALFPDANYNLALLRWLLNTLLATDADLHPAPAELPQWRQTLARLTPFVVGPDGLMIGRGQALEMSHRHYSHLLALYPLFQLSPGDPADRALVDKSVVHWHRLEGGRRLTGYSFTGAASLYAALGRGHDAVEMLNTLLDGPPGGAYISHNTFYFESGGKNPVIETPLSGGAAIADLVLQSWGGKLRIFPAIPSAWADASFQDLRGQGGFLVSAQRTAGRTAWVTVRSLAGEPCVVRVPDWTTPPRAAGAREFTITMPAPGEFALDLRRGEHVALWPAGPRPDFVAQPAASTAGRANAYGVKAGDTVPLRHVWPETLP